MKHIIPDIYLLYKEEIWMGSWNNEHSRSNEGYSLGFKSLKGRIYVIWKWNRECSL